MKKLTINQRRQISKKKKNKQIDFNLKKQI